ncbi:hypothetical protein Tamer19_47470 [Cupriavidus sp. TA19]|nr:hypothetical protein Tamer19_47470 [Cupriavidus sp. TA19]
MGLKHRLTVMFDICLIDFNNGTPIYKAATSATLSEEEVGADQLQPAKQFFVGEIQQLLDGPELEQQFLEALEGAYQTYEQGDAPPSGDVLRLTKE